MKKKVFGGLGKLDAFFTNNLRFYSTSALRKRKITVYLTNKMNFSEIICDFCQQVVCKPVIRLMISHVFRAHPRSQISVVCDLS